MVHIYQKHDKDHKSSGFTAVNLIYQRTVAVNNSTNINKNEKSPRKSLNIKYDKNPERVTLRTKTCWTPLHMQIRSPHLLPFLFVAENPGPGLWQAQKYGWVKLITWIRPLSLWDILCFVSSSKYHYSAFYFYSGN